MKNILNHDGTSQLLLSNIDDGSNRIFINDVEIPSSSWVGTGNYTQTISGTTITIAKVADLDGNVMLQLVSANTYRLVKYVKAEYLTTTGDTKDNVTTFQSSDTTDALATAWTSVTKLDSGEKQSSIFAKMSQMFKNIRYLYKMLGTTDISQIGGGNVTGAISSLNTSLATLIGAISSFHFGEYHSWEHTKITGTRNNQIYLLVGLAGTSDGGTYLSFLFKQQNNNSIGWKRDFGGTPFASVTYKSNSYEIQFTNTTTYGLMMVISNSNFTLS